MERRSGTLSTIGWIVLILVIIFVCCPLAWWLLSGNFTLGGRSTTNPDSRIILSPAQVQSGIRTTCDFAAGFDNSGDIADKAISVRGPAIIEQDKSNIVVIYAGKTYTAQKGDVYWRYNGDSACLESQLGSFPGMNIKKVR